MTDDWETRLREAGIDPDTVPPGATIDLNTFVARVKQPAKPSKYRNTKVKADGYTFDSKAEYQRYLVLKLWQEQGVIQDLQVHPRYELLPAFTDSAGERHRGISYVADFAYQENTQQIVEDVKGVETQVFKIKKKLLLHRYPDLVFRQINVKEKR
ncbi:DUF1064 domain-containing protein [Chloroflexota bacterium]